ncbi:unnamed protein product [Effrenium voratum]|nr:unnamed protein product [Effrenium voratum]
MSASPRRGLGLAALVFVLGLQNSFVSEAPQSRPEGRVALKAKKEQNVFEAAADFLKPRYGKGTERVLPSNAEMIGTLKIVYEVTLPKPLGITLADAPRGAGFGVGVEDVVSGGNAAKLLQEVLNGKDSMWIQEGDELEAVNDVPTDGFQDKAVSLIQESGDTVKLQLSRPRKGFIKVVFPDGKSATSPRAAILKRLAEKVGYNSGCTCTDGRCGKCWHRDPITTEVYVLPLNCAGLVPSVWRRSDEDGARPGEADFECWIPLKLEKAPEEFDKALKEEAEASKQQGY